MEGSSSAVVVLGTDVILNDSDNPFCEHGPTILFEKFFKDKPSRKYFACAACRERKQCPIFQWKDEKLTTGKKITQEVIKKKLLKMKFKDGPTVHAGDEWCRDCGSPASGGNHGNHVIAALSKTDLQQPTSLIQPKSNKKSNAQYFFSDETCSLLTTNIKRLQFKKIICIGAPRLIEKLSCENISTILLDIDERFCWFYNSLQFLRYNMFNNFFFDMKHGQEKLKKFIGDTSADHVIIVVDPPFGGLVELLANSLAKLTKLLWADEVMTPTMLIFPYFLEPHVLHVLSSFRMLDFKVSYTNHTHFNNSSKRGSPVRIFTNIPADKVALPKEGYRFCKLCQRYVYKDNRHCLECKYCTSKDGRTYKHCKKCAKCVKPGRIHCESCSKCELPVHQCSTNPAMGCHICGDLDHKRKDCPAKITGKPNDSREKTNSKRKADKAEGTQNQFKKLKTESKRNGSNVKKKNKPKIRI